MSRPAWSSAPEWVQWIAQDADGVWNGYDIKPRAMGKEFARPGLSQPNHGRFITLERAAPASDWRSTLEQRPPLSLQRP